MARVKRAAIALVVLLIAATAFLKTRGNGGGDTPPEVPKLFSGEWSAATFHDVLVPLPIEFDRKENAGEHQVVFYGPEELKTPSIQVHRRPVPKNATTTAAWHKWQRDKWDSPDPDRSKVLEEGSDTIAGRPCKFFTYRVKHRGAYYLFLQWNFVKDGIAYWVRGQADEVLFVNGFREVLHEVKRGVQLTH